MRKAWDAGLYPQPAGFAILWGLWQEPNLAWTTEWLRMLRRQSASVTDEWHRCRTADSELQAAAERARRDAVSRFYTGRELQQLLHPRAPAQHSSALYTNIPDKVQVTGDGRALAAFQHNLGAEWIQVDMVEGAVCVSGIKPADLGRILTLAEQGGLRTELIRQKRIVQGVTDRLCAWESELATEAKATKARCVSCGGHCLVPVTSDDQAGRTVKWWCAPCSGFRH